MIELIPFEEAHIVGIRLDGRFDDEGFGAVVAAIDTAQANNDKINIYAEAVSIGGMSIDTFLETIKVKFNYLKASDKFEKEAIVSDKRWLESLIKVGDKLFPSIEVRYFSSEEKEAALAYVKAGVRAEP
jgi:hypothetical protein